jgi:hypothetical protein
MTVTAPSAPAPPAPRRRVWALVACWAVALIVLAFGVWSAATALVWNDQVVDYANTRNDAERVADIGRRAVRVGDELCGCDSTTVQLRQQARDALAAGDVDRYNELVVQLNDELGRHNTQAVRLSSLLSGL